MQEISRRRFFGLLGGVVATAVAPPRYILPPAGGWASIFDRFVSVDYGFNESWAVAQVVRRTAAGLYVVEETGIRLMKMRPGSLAQRSVSSCAQRLAEKWGAERIYFTNGGA